MALRVGRNAISVFWPAIVLMSPTTRGGETWSEKWFERYQRVRGEVQQLIRLDTTRNWSELADKANQFLGQHPRGSQSVFVRGMRARCFERMERFPDAIKEYRTLAEGFPFESAAVHAERRIRFLEKASQSPRELGQYLAALLVEKLPEKLRALKELSSRCQNREVLSAALCDVAFLSRYPEGKCEWEDYYDALFPLVVRFPDTYAAREAAMTVVAHRAAPFDDTPERTRRLRKEVVDWVIGKYPGSYEAFCCLTTQLFSEAPLLLETPEPSRALRPDSKEVWRTRRALDEMEKLLPLAKAACQRAHVECVFYLVRGHLVLNDLRGAEKWYGELLGKYPEAPDTAEALYSIGVFLEKRGETGRAHVVYRETCQRFPDSPFAPLAHRRVAPAAWELDQAKKALSKGVPKGAEPVAPVVPPDPE